MDYNLSQELSHNHSHPSILLLALAKNCRVGVIHALHALTRLNEDGRVSISMIIGEDGSTDGTRQLLEKASTAALPITLVDTTAIEKITNRYARMARAREIVKNEAEIQIAKADYEVAIIGVVDVDEPFLSAITVDHILNAISKLHQPNIFGVSATSRPTYYDLIAYKDEQRSFTSLISDIKALEKNPIAYYRLFRQVIYPAQFSLTMDHDWHCLSAFNGLAFYRATDYVGTSYEPTDPALARCEHVTLNTHLNETTGASMLIDADLCLPTPREHGHRSIIGFVIQRVLKLIKRLA